MRRIIADYKRQFKRAMFWRELAALILIMMVVAFVFQAWLEGTLFAIISIILFIVSIVMRRYSQMSTYLDMWDKIKPLTQEEVDVWIECTSPAIGILVDFLGVRVLDVDLLEALKASK